MMNTKTQILPFILLLFACSLFGQMTPIDSLAQLPVSISVKERVGLVKRISVFFRTIQTEEEKKSLADQYLKIATSRNDSLFLASAYFHARDFQKQKEIQRRYGWHLDAADDDQFLYYTLNIYHDKKGNTSFREIRNNDQLFGINQTHARDYNYNPKDVYWAKLILYGKSDKTNDYLFHFSSNGNFESWKNIDAWMVHANDSIQYYQTGDQFLEAEKPIPSKFNMLRYTIQQNEKVVLYFRMEGLDEEKINQPKGVRVYLIEEDKWPGLFPNYPFKGKFRPKIRTSPYNFNEIINHDLYIDTTETKGIDEIMAMPKEAWEPPSKILIEADKVYWLHKRFYGSPYFNGEQILHISPWFGDDRNSFDYIDSYTSNEHGGYDHQRTGVKVPLKNRAFNHWINFIKLDIGMTDTLDLWVRMEGGNARFIIPETELSLFHVDPFSLFPSQSNFAWGRGLFYGIVGIQTIFFLFLFMIEKERIHFYFSMIGLGLFLIAASNLTSEFISYEPFPMLRDYSISIFVIGMISSIVGLLKFVESYFNYNKDFFYRKWLVPGLSLIMLIVGIYAAFQFQFVHEDSVAYASKPYFMLIVLIGIAGIMVSFGAAIKAPKQKNVSKLFFFLAFTPLIITTLVYSFISLYHSIK